MRYMCPLSLGEDRGLIRTGSGNQLTLPSMEHLVSSSSDFGDTRVNRSDLLEQEWRVWWYIIFIFFLPSPKELEGPACTAIGHVCPGNWSRCILAFHSGQAAENGFLQWQFFGTQLRDQHGESAFSAGHRSLSRRAHLKQPPQDIGLGPGWPWSQSQFSALDSGVFPCCGILKNIPGGS